MNELGGDFQQVGSRPVAFNGHPSTHRHLIGLRNKPQKKYLAVVLWQLVSLLMKLLIDDEKFLCHCVRM